MKINMPVTDKEVIMKPDTILVTRTNLKGIITEANEAFIEISGFSADELVGKNHNVVRHPDMPPEAFADLWQTIKAGYPWVGLVKNRTKSGDYYWVEANVTPVYKNGRLHEFLSCRYAPSREQIRDAEALYDQVRKKQVVLGKKSIWDRINFIKNFSLAKKMTVIGLFLLLPSLVLMGLLYVEKTKTIRLAQQEIQGSEYLQPLQRVLAHIALHRGLSNGYLTTDKTTDSTPIIQAATMVAKDIKAVDKLQGLYGGMLATLDSWQAVKQNWGVLESQTLNLTAEQNFKKHTDLINQILALFVQVGDSSTLILDPDLDSFYLMDMQVVRLPELMENLGRLRGYGSGLTNLKQISQTQLVKLAVMREKVNNLLLTTLHDIDTAIDENAQLDDRLSDKRAALSTGIHLFLASIDQLLAGQNNISSQQLFTQGTEAIRLTDDLYQETATNLQLLLEHRITGLKYDLYISLVSVLALVLVALWLSYLLVHRVMKNLDTVTNVFYRLTDGEFRNSFDFSGQDELGALLKALQAMQVKMNVDLASAKDLAIKGQRIQQALDTVESCVMVANNSLDIIYMNNTVQEMFKNAESDIKKQLPNFNADELLGANIDAFHKNPNHQRTMLANLTSTVRSNLIIGGRHMNFVANPVLSDEGDRIGTVVEWRDRTHEVKIEQEIEAIVESVKAGQLDTRIEMADKIGFFAKLSEGINELTDVIDRAFSDVNSSLQSISSGELSNRIEADYSGIYLECKNNVNVTIDKLAEIVGQINESADFINTSAQEIASGNNNLSQRAEQQAASLEQTASSMEQLTSTVKNNADNAQQADQVAATARQLAERGGDVVTSAVAAMQEINDSSNKIAEIIGVIDEIAFQTNLLALNASVEAARAGEQGRGFSVVATEVRNLAQRSATAARESKDLIQTSVQKVRSGTEFVNQTGKSLSEIVTGVKKVGDIVAEIAAASVEQSQGIEQVNQAVSQMDEITQQNAALAEQASAASVSMSEQSDNMNQLLSFFRIENKGSNTGYQSNQADTLAAKHLDETEQTTNSDSNSGKAVSQKSTGIKQAVHSQPTLTPNQTVDSDDDWEEF